MIVRYLFEVFDDLDEIGDYVAGNAGRRVALRVTDRILDLADGLTLFPHRHEAIPLLPEDPRIIRRLPYQTYMIIYRVDDKTEEIVILGVFATRRDLAGLEVILGRG